MKEEVPFSLLRCISGVGFVVIGLSGDCGSVLSPGLKCFIVAE